MTQIHDLRTFMSVLEENGQLARIKKPVSLVYELADVAAALERSGAGAGLFERPEGSPWPIFTSGVASQKRAALALDCGESGIIDTMERVLEPAHGVAPTRVDKAVWMANVRTGKDVDVGILPIPTHSRGDGGAFVTGGVTLTRDPLSGRGNLSYNRMLRMGPVDGHLVDGHLKEFGFNLNEWRHVGMFMKSRPDPLAPFPAAIAIGLDPAITIAAGVRTEADELTIAGAIRGEPVAVARGVTVDVDIPAYAEIVVEGFIQPGVRKPEGPLAEFHGYYGELWNSPTFMVTAVCWRDEPIYQTIIPGWYEHIYIGNVLPREPLLRRFVRHIDKNANVHIPAYANGFAAIIQTRRDNPGQPKNLAMAAMTAHINIRDVIVVDEDIDIYDAADVMWALVNRVDPRLDVFTVASAQGHEMDPTADQRGVGAKMGIDATYKRERREYGERVRYPAVDLAQYLGG